MKKLVLVLAVAFSASLFACGSKENNAANDAVVEEAVVEEVATVDTVAADTVVADSVAAPADSVAA